MEQKIPKIPKNAEMERNKELQKSQGEKMPPGLKNLEYLRTMSDAVRDAQRNIKLK